MHSAAEKGGRISDPMTIKHIISFHIGGN